MIEFREGAQSGHRMTLKDLKLAVAAKPDDARAVLALGVALMERNELAPALSYLSNAAELDPINPVGHYYLGEVLSTLRRFEEAAEAYRTAFELSPQDTKICLRMGKVYEDLGRSTEALRSFIHVIELAPDNLMGYAGISRICIDGKSAEEGEAIASRLTQHVNRPIDLMKGMAHALESQGRFQEARSYWERILKQAPDDISVLMRSANVEMALRNIEAASAIFKTALALHPTNATVTWGQAMFHFRTGRLDRALELLRGFPTQPNTKSQPKTISPPGGELKWGAVMPDLNRKRVLVNGKGGYGDVLQECRFISLIKERGAHVIFECPPLLKRLCATLSGADEVVAVYDECSSYDYQCEASYIPAVFEWTWEWAAKNSPYLFASNKQRSPWAEIRGRKGLKIGVNWRSNDQNKGNTYSYRSVPLAEFYPLSALPQTTIFGLQVGPGAEELTASTREWVTENLGDKFKDFTDSAEAIMALDAVVTADTSMAHLAGALGKMCFIILPYYPHYRWMGESDAFARNMCQWYPSARVFRQERPGDWSTVINAVTRQISALTQANCYNGRLNSGA